MSIKGITPPTQSGMIAGNPADSAIKAGNIAAIKQANLINAVGGSKKMKGGTIAISSLKTSYTPTGGQGQNPADINKQLAQIGSQGNANAQFDSHAFKGGKKNTFRKSTFRKYTFKKGKKGKKGKKCKKGRKSKKSKK